MSGNPSRIVAAALALLTAAPALANPVKRLSVDQHGDMLVFGNTLAQDCSANAVQPVVGSVTINQKGGSNTCGGNTSDSGADVLWRSDAPSVGSALADTTITAANARSTAVLSLPAGATVTYARLYWSAEVPTNTAGTQVTIERPSASYSTTLTAATSDQLRTTYNSQFFYQSSVDVTSILASYGNGAYRVGNILVRDPTSIGANDEVLYAAWSIVVFYRLDSAPPRNLTLFDGLDVVNSNTVTSIISGFTVPNSGYDAKLAVVAYEGDDSITGDSLSMNGTTLSNSSNPATNFFNSTHSGSTGAAITTVGDLPQQTGANGSMSGVDIDTVDVTARVTAGATSATISATSSGDVYFLGVLATSISTFKPDFSTTTKTWADVTHPGGPLLPGDVIEYTIATQNTGNDTSINTVLDDPLPSSVTYVPGTLQITSGYNAGAKTDAAADDQGEYAAASRTIHVRLGAGANSTTGGTLTTSDAAQIVKFRVTVNPGTGGQNIENTATITAAGQNGAPSTSTSSNNGTPTTFAVDQCTSNSDCSGATPFCFNSGTHPYVCVACLDNSACSGQTPTCDLSSHTCAMCSADGAPSCTNPSQPACNTSGPLTGACTQCSATNSTQCTGGTPVCDTSQGLCVQCTSNTQCSGINNTCDTTQHKCVRSSPLQPPVIVAPANGSTIATTTPTISGTVEANAQVQLYVDGTLVGTVTANGSGNWSDAMTAMQALAQGSHQVYGIAIDAASNTSAPSAFNTFVVDTLAPNAPVVIAPANGSRTNNTKPTVSGTAEANSTVTVYIDGASVGTTTASAGGAWSFPLSAALGDGLHQVKATASDAVGNISVFSNTNTFTVDTTPPAAPVVTAPANGSITTDTTPTFTGTAEPGSTVTLTIDGTTVTVTADGSGNWSYTPASPLPDGTVTVSATATDALGNTGPSSAPISFTIDSAAPPAPIVVTPTTGTVTNNNRPVVTGTAEPSSTVTVFIDGAPVGTTTADASGNWTFTPATPLADGTREVSATATDAAGNVSPPSLANSFIVDTTPPAAPVVLVPGSGTATADNTPAISGTAEPGSTVTVFLDGSPVGTAMVDAGGNWTLTVPAPLLDGGHTVTATATDAAGNTGPASTPNTFTVDTTAPAAPIVIAPADGSISANNQPTISGTAEPGTTVAVFLSGTQVGTTTATPGGIWSFTVPAPVPDASYAASAIATDAVGNASARSNINTFTVDTSAPTAPVIATPVNGTVTSNPSPVITGTAEPGSTVTLFVDGLAVDTFVVDATGNWSYTPSPLADGAHTVHATATDSAGNTSAPSNAPLFTVDTAPPAAPVLSAPADGARIAETTPTVSGTAEPGATVSVIIDGLVVGTTTADPSGNWSFTPTSPLADGAHDVSATATDVAGNTGPASATNHFTIDTTPPAAPIVSAPANGSVTNDSTPDVNGTAEADSSVTVYVDGVAVGTATADGSGAWSFVIPTALAEGDHTVKVTATDAVGNVSAFSNENAFRVDTAAPAAPTVATPADGSITSNPRPVISGTAEPLATVTIVLDGVPYATTTATSIGAWSETPGTNIADGPHTVNAYAYDAAGNVSATSNTNGFTIDTTVPPPPTVLTPADGSTTANDRPAISGSAVPFNTVSVYLDGQLAGTTSADAAGVWTLTPPTALVDGLHQVWATQADAANNLSTTSNTNTFDVDTLAPAAPVVVAPADGSITSNPRPQVTGSAEAFSTVTVFIDGSAAGTATTSALGAWSFTPATALADGDHAVFAKATDAAGNASVQSNTNAFTVDTAAPGAPVVVTPADGSITSNNRPVISGSAEAGSTVTVSVDGNVLGTTTADGTGNWTFTPASALSDGAHDVHATATDAAGNSSATSNTNHFTVDATAPAAPMVVTPADGELTSNNRPAITGTAEAGSTVTIVLDGTEVGTTTADGSGNWAFTPASALQDGAHEVHATAKDAAGNTSADSNSNHFTVDTASPAAPVVSAPADGSVTSDSTPVISGTADAGATVTVKVDGQVLGTTTANGSGGWSFTPASALLDGGHDVNATATDAAGNVSAVSNTNHFVVDTTASGAPVVLTPVDGLVTRNPQPVVSGTADANAQVTVYLDGVVAGTVTADASGNWSFTPAVLAEGAHDAKATQTDSAGNTSVFSNDNAFTVDGTAPSAPVVVTPADASVTANDRPAITGTSEANATVTVSIDGTAAGTTTANSSGAWTFTPASALSDGAHTANATATDAAGNVSGVSNTNHFTVDTSAPSAPVVVTPADGSITGNNHPVISGTAEAGSDVALWVDGTLLTTVTADGSGNWTFTPVTALQDGAHQVYAAATDSAGNQGGTSATTHFTVDTAVPAAPVVATPADGALIRNNRPAISGTAEAGATVTVFVDGNPLGTVSADGSGNWTLTPASALAEGQHAVHATATDAALNVSGVSNTNTFTIDSVAPAAPVVVAPADGAVLANATPVISGTAEANSTVTVSLDGAQLGTTTANGAGAWSITPASALSDGAHQVNATATDAAGNVSPSSNTNHFAIDTVAPPAPVVIAPADGSITHNPLPLITGTGEPGATVTVVLDGAVVGTVRAGPPPPVTVDGSGNWAFTPASPLADGQHQVSAIQTDAAGNTSPSSSVNTFTVDTQAPGAPVINSPADGSTTADSTPTVSGTAEPGSTVAVLVDGVPAGTAVADGSGHWSVTLSTDLSDGPHTVSATATDGAGNTSAAATSSFNVLATAPDTTIEQHPAASTTDTTADFTLASDESPVTFECRLDGASTFTACAASLHLDALTVGPHSLEVRAVNAVGTPDPTPAQFGWTVVQALVVDTTIVSAPPADQAPTTATFSFSSNVDGATYECQLDGAAFAACANPVTFTGLIDGAHTLQVRAVAPTGEMDSTPASYQWNVQSSAPVESHTYGLRGGGLGCSESSGGIAGAAAVLALLSLLTGRGARRRVR